MTRVLVVCPDKTGPLMAGTAIRSVEIARALAPRCDVTLAVPADSAPIAGDLVQIRVPADSTLPPLVAAADVVVISGRAEIMTAIRKPLVVDLYDPFILSDLEFYGPRFTSAGGRPLLALRWLQHHLANGDLFLCASEGQRSFWLGMLAAAGRVNRANYEAGHAFEELLAVVPFGIPGPPPVHTRRSLRGVIPGIAPDDTVVLWAGGLWNWFDPLTLLHAVARVRERRPEVKALFLGVRHPNPHIGAMEMAVRARALADELALTASGAFFVDWVPYAERQNYLLESDVGVSLHQPGIEAQFAFRTRVLDYLWCGLPMVLSRGDDLALRVEREGLGVTVPAGDVDAVAAAIVQLIDDPDRQNREPRFAALREELSWTRVIEPVARFCAAPRFAPDKARGAWFAPETPVEGVPLKEDALISEEFLTTDREISQPLGKHYSVGHTFLAAYDDLCRIDVLTWITEPRPPVDLIMTLREEGPDGRQIARVVTPLATLPHDEWQRFEFRPIPNSGGRRYHINVEIPGTTASGVSLWLCRGEENEPSPALVAHYLVKGVAEELPIANESFLFLHNTTISDALVPGIGALAAEGEAFAASLLAANPAEADSRAPAAADAPCATAPPVAADSGPEPAPPSRAARASDAIRAELARVSAELVVTRRELAGLAADYAAGRVEARVLPRLVHELAHEARRASRLGIRLAGMLLIAVLVVLSVPLAAVTTLALALTDAWTALRRRQPDPSPSPGSPPSGVGTSGPTEPWIARPVSVVIPTWNGRSLLEMSLPPLRAALATHAPGGEIIVVDNGSSDGTAAFLAQQFPDVRVLALDRNEGFAGATNRGARASRHPTLILLNNDMVVEPDFIAPLLEAFDEEPDVFGVSTQIDFIDKEKPRWETGKVHARWKHGAITLFHTDQWDDACLYPVFFAGGGASAYDREKFLALDGFDEGVFAPVYIEDVDLGYRAWKRGWPSLFQPRSRVHHKHRGTTRRLWSEHQIYSFFVKNLSALVLKNVRDRRLLARALGGIVILPARVWSQSGAKAAVHTFTGLWRQIGRVMRARAREATLPRALDDAPIFVVSRYRHAYRAHFGRRTPRAPEAPLRVLVVSPYSPYPPIHGGAVRMLALLERLGRVCEITLLSYGDTTAELDPRSIAELRKRCRTVVVLERETGAVGGILTPSKTRGFWSDGMAYSLEYLLDRGDFDVIQIEYTHMAHFMPPPALGLLRVLVEHDVCFVSLARSRAAGWVARVGLWFDWMRTLRYEIAAVERADLVLTMSGTDRALLGRLVDARHIVPIPNGVDCTAFPYCEAGRIPDTILFVGFFRHEPNVEAVRYFSHTVLPLVRREVPGARFRVVGAYPPGIVQRLAGDAGVEVIGQVAEIRPWYQESAVFVAPVLQGSGTRLKILEAMASGCPVVSTTIGAEGLDAIDGKHLLIGDDPERMAQAVVALLRDASHAATLAREARAFVVERYDWNAIAERLLSCYREALAAGPRRSHVRPPLPRVIGGD